MAASSPVANNNSKAVGEPVNIITSAATINVGSKTPQSLITVIDTTTPKQSQRGQNKPKCIKCGNVARSRCPFQSCKNCCATAQNPCHIHVLKQSSILPAQPPPSATPLPGQRQQPSSDASSTGPSWRLSSLRQLSAAFASTMRVKKPLTRKDAVNINKWRFSKLKEHIEGHIEAENEAFDRYMWNVSLLEETFSTERLLSDGQIAPEPTSSLEDEFQKLVSSMKVKLKSNAEKADSCRERIRDLVGQLLRKLHKKDLAPGEDSPYADGIDACKEPKRPKKAGEWRTERTAAFSDLIDTLSKACSEDDLKPCLEMKLQLLNRSESKPLCSSGEQDPVKSLETKQEPDTISDFSVYSPLKTCTIVRMDQDSLSNINTELSSISQLAEL